MVEGKVIHKPTVAVIGAGLAGLTAASLLSRKGFGVIVIEKKAIPGGRTFSLPNPRSGGWMDNGQHILMGCYAHTLLFLNDLHQSDALRNGSLLTKVRKIRYRDESGTVTMPLSLAGLLAFKRWSLPERIAFLARFRGIISQRNNHGNTIGEGLKKHHQSERHRKYFWKPLCLAIMNETIGVADPTIFFAALRTIFSGRKNSAIYVPAVSLKDLFINPALKIIGEHEGEIRCGTNALKIINSCNHVNGIELSDGKVISADYYVSALPLWDLQKILSFEQQVQLWNEPVICLTSPIISAYIRYQNLPACFSPLKPMTGCYGGIIQWLFVRADHSVAVTISAAQALENIPAEVIKEKILNDLRRLFGAQVNQNISSILVIKERRATFSLRHDRPIFRPPVETAWKNFFIAGDGTDTGLPSTIESAVRSGYQAAEKIIRRTEAR